MKRHVIVHVRFRRPFLKAQELVAQGAPAEALSRILRRLLARPSEFVEFRPEAPR